MPIQFPNPATWIPNVDVLNDVGEGLLSVAAGALDLFDDPTAPAGETRTLAARYERQYVGHGTEAPVVHSKAKQLTVVCPRVYIGRAGEEQYQFAKGEAGKFGYQTGLFVIELSAPWPAPTRGGGAAPALVPVPDLDLARGQVWRDGTVVFAAMIGLALGGIQRPWEPSNVRADGMAVGPLAAKDPSGGAASWTCQVHVEI